MPTVVNKVVKYSGGDYTTIQAALDAIPANLVTSDQQWNILLDESSAGNTEWVITSMLSIATTTTDATRYVRIAPNTGKSFRDHPNKLTNALRANAANGVVIRRTGGNGGILSADTANLRLEGLQLSSSVGGPDQVLGAGDGLLVKNCIIFYVAQSYFVNASGTKKFVNCVFYTTYAYALLRWSSKLEFYNCTFYSPDSVNALLPLYNEGHVLKNCVIIGSYSGGAVPGPENFSATNSGNNATHQASGLPGNAGNVYSLTIADTVQSTISGSQDFRAKPTGGLRAAATRDQANTDDLDIVGRARSTTAPTIGAWEIPWELYGVVDETTLDTADYVRTTAVGSDAALELTKDGTAGISQPQAGTSIFVDLDTGLVDGAEIAVDIIDDRVI